MRRVLVLVVVMGALLYTLSSFRLASAADMEGKIEDNTIAATETAIFAGGCFWCMQPPFDKLAGVISTTAGYCGGAETNPTYSQVSSGSTSHAESIQVVYDSKKISYEQLLEVFWKNIDPTTPNRQFCDTGKQYRSAIFYLNDQQKQLALNSLEKLKSSKGAIVTEVTPATTFYPAEDYHQQYYLKNPEDYKRYRSGCGRDAKLAELWGK